MHAIIRTKKHKSVNSLRSREAHTYRKRVTPNADPRKETRNKLLFGRESYADLCEEKLENYDRSGNKIRKDAVVCIEYLLTASPEFFKNGPLHERQDRLKGWCKNQVDFLKQMHGANNILNVYLHLDESTPHLEAYIFPIDPKGKLNCKYFLGGPAKLSKLQTDYAKHNEKFGLIRGIEGSRASHTEVKQFYSEIKKTPKVTKKAVLNALKISAPGMRDLLNPIAYISREQKRILENVTQLFSGMAEEAKLVRNTKNMLIAWERRENYFSKKEYEWEKRIEEWNRDRAALVDRLMEKESLSRELQDTWQYAENLQRENQYLNKQLAAKGKHGPGMKLTPPEKKQ